MACLADRPVRFLRAEKPSRDVGLAGGAKAVWGVLVRAVANIRFIVDDRLALATQHSPAKKDLSVLIVYCLSPIAVTDRHAELSIPVLGTLWWCVCLLSCCMQPGSPAEHIEAVFCCRASRTAACARWVCVHAAAPITVS